MTGATGSLTPGGSTEPFVPAETRLLYGPPLREVSGGQPATHDARPELPPQRQAEAAASLREQSGSPYRGPGALGGDHYQREAEHSRSGTLLKHRLGADAEHARELGQQRRSRGQEVKA